MLCRLWTEVLWRLLPPSWCLALLLHVCYHLANVHLNFFPELEARWRQVNEMEVNESQLSRGERRILITLLCFNEGKASSLWNSSVVCSGTVCMEREGKNFREKYADRFERTIFVFFKQLFIGLGTTWNVKKVI